MSLEKQFSITKPGDVGIIGDPIDHSLSPLIQNAAFQTWKMAFEDREIVVPVYHKFHVLPDELPKALDLMKQYQLKGLNVTIPHKVSVGSYVQKWDTFAKKAGAINTLLLDKDVLKGFNTDGDGFRRAVERDLGFDAEGKSVFVLGAGGTGRVIAHQLASMGVKHLFIWNRHLEKINALVAEFENGVDLISAVQTPTEISQALESADLIVNSTSVGLKESDGLPLEGLHFRSHQYVFDVIYNHETSFLKRARADHARTLGGESMLLYQGGRAFEIWTGTPAPYDIMRKTLSKIMKGQG